MGSPPIGPVATYRLQLTDDFAFAEVTGILDQLVELGISHLYLSPILEAVPGSAHGYDWLPPARIAERLGGPDGLRLLRAHARALHIGLILDIVPNHVGIAIPPANPWWCSVLQHGFDSPYAGYFDLHPVILDDGAEVIALPCLHSEADLAGLRLDADGRLHFHEWVLPTAPGTARPGDDPLEVHERQHYRLVRSDTKAMSYRRFLAIGELAALRQEEPGVFEATHGWLRELIDEDLIDGVRVDHLDGLRAPLEYVRRLRELLGPDRLLYVEKGLVDDEPLDPALAADGTTGYEQLALIEGVFTPAPGVVELDEAYRTLTGGFGHGDPLMQSSRELREEVLRRDFPTRLRWASLMLAETAPELPLYTVEQAVALFAAGCPVARPDYPALRERVLAAVDDLAARHPGTAPALRALAAVFADPAYAPEAHFRISDLTAAVTAVAVEQVGFHRTARLVSSQELGATPRLPSIGRSEFHRRSRLRARRQPLAMTALTTHDTKRSSDVRARIAILAQVPQRWQLLVDALWRQCPPPDRILGYLLLQNLIGVWPDTGLPDPELRARLARYARHALRHGAQLSSWRDPDLTAETAMLAWLDGLCEGEPAALIADFVGLIAPVGEQESLARLAVALLSPGVPDLYQGAQWPSRLLSDPDNRRPVDYQRPLTDPRARLIAQGTALRRRHADSFGVDGDYRPLASRGRFATHVLSFARGPVGGEAQVVLAVLRMSHSLPPGPDRALVELELPSGRWRDVQNGAVHSGVVDGQALFGARTVAMLERAD